MKLASCLVTQNYDPRFGTFPCLKALSDFTTVLDDNSIGDKIFERVVKFQDHPDECLRLYRRDGSLWNDTANRTMLMYRAYLAGCEYVLPWSGDVLPSLDLFHLLSTFPDFIPRMNDIDFFQCELRELWSRSDHPSEGPDYWRSDGVWSQKKNVFMQRNWFFDDELRFQHPDERLHKYPFSAAHIPRIHDLPAGCAVYHFGSMTTNQRNARVTKYSVEDSKNQFQKDYTYLADETGKQLSLVPQQDREFFNRWMKL